MRHNYDLVEKYETGRQLQAWNIAKWPFPRTEVQSFRMEDPGVTNFCELYILRADAYLVKVQLWNNKVESLEMLPLL